MANSGELDIARRHMAAGRWEDAHKSLLRIVQRTTKEAEPARLLALASLQLGQFDQCVYYSRRAIALQPRDVATRHRLVQLLMGDHRYDEALAASDVEAAGGDVGTVLCRSIALNALGRADEAFALLEKVPPSAREELFIATNGAAMAAYTVHTSAAQRRRMSERFGKALADRLPISPVKFENSREPARRLRVGLASPDLRRHAVGYMVEMLLRGLAGRELELYCYSGSKSEDDLTDRIKGMCAGWRNIAADDARVSAAAIQQDRVDVLIDLAGHTAGHLLAPMHLRCAPVQATWYGHPGTTGVAAIDYRIVDAITDPPGSEEWSTEKLIRMEDCFAALTPDAEKVETLAPPSQRSGSGSEGHITIGSFSTISKLNDELIGLWARVLEAVPGSRLLLRHMGLRHAGPRKLVMERFAKTTLGASARERVVLMEPAANAEEMLPTYQKIDIALDTWPYNGTTTTMEALWMGVPVVSLIADRSAGRVGLSLLSAVGLEDLVARTPDDYVRIAAGLAADAGRMRQLRATLRDKYKASPLGDAAHFAGRFERAVRTMWREYCERAQ